MQGLLGISLRIFPWEIPQRSPASPRKTPTFPPLLHKLTQYACLASLQNMNPPMGEVWLHFKYLPWCPKGCHRTTRLSIPTYKGGMVLMCLKYLFHHPNILYFWRPLTWAVTLAIFVKSPTQLTRKCKIAFHYNFILKLNAPELLKCCIFLESLDTIVS